MAKEPWSTKDPAFSHLLALLLSDALIVTRRWTLRDSRRTGVFGLNESLLPAGNWLIFAQTSFQASISTDSELEMQVRLNVRDGSNFLMNRVSYLRLKGLAFGTATEIGAVTVSGGPASLELTYAFQKFGPDDGAPDVRDSMIIAIKTPDFVAVA